ncbi:hypothetical protein [Tenacibaculum sp. SZ-18]|nr:hypothetical protein [Tenacibaculum sp. SZ-18]
MGIARKRTTLLTSYNRAYTTKGEFAINHFKSLSNGKMTVRRIERETKKK